MNGGFVVVFAGLNRIFLLVLRTFHLLLTVGVVTTTVGFVHAAPREVEGRVKKVLPHLLDDKGAHTVSPSLFDRDAYQAHLRANPEKVTGIRYDVHWKVRHAEFEKVTVRIELRGIFEGKVPREKTLEKTFEGGGSMRKWTGFELTGKTYTEFGKITAWRATLWCGDEMVDEYKSFLW